MMNVKAQPAVSIMCASPPVQRVCPAVKARAALLDRLRSGERWDMVVIGGGATGLGCAVDAAARGYKVLLLESHDFAQGTSSRSTKLIHGGVRYLAQGNIALVREALLERTRLLRNAPAIVTPQRFVVPVHGWLERARMLIGLKAYDWLAGRHGMGRCENLDVAATRAALPNLRVDGCIGGVAYWDARFDDARLCIALLRTLKDLGGEALNHAEVLGVLKEGHRVAGVSVRTVESGAVLSVCARVVINASGVWADDIRRMENPEVHSMLRPSQGVHIVVPRRFLPGDQALLVPHTRDGRVLFAIPWLGQVLMGTTDQSRPDKPFEPHALPGEVEFILETAQAYLQQVPTRADILSVFAGLRPLVAEDTARDTSRLSREHKISVSAGGLVTISGGKWTTYRRMAEDTIDRVESVAGLRARRSVTADLGLNMEGAQAAGHTAEGELAAPDESLVRQAVCEEMALTVEDVLARRLRWLFVDANAAAGHAADVARWMAPLLGQDEQWCAQQVRTFVALARRYQAVDAD